MRSRWLLGATAFLLLLTGPAWGSNLTEVRAGVHPDFTRVVLQLDAATPYSLIQLTTKENGIHVLHLSVKATPRPMPRVAPRGSPHVKGVAVSGRPDGTADVRIRLRGELELKELVLRGPDRIVLDFFAVGSGKGSLVSALVPPDLGSSLAGSDAGATTEKAPAERPTLDEAHDAEFNQALAEAESALQAAAREADAEAARVEAETARREAEAQAAAPTPEDLEAELEAELASMPEAGDAAFDEGSDTSVEDPAAGDSDAFAGVEMAEVVPDEPTRAEPAETPATPAEDSGGSLLGSPLALAAIAGVALIGLLFVFGRRRKADDADESLSPLDASEGGVSDDNAGLGGLFDGNDVNEERSEAEEVTDADAPAPFVGSADENDTPEAIIVSDDAADTNDSPSEEPTVDEGFDYPAISPASGASTSAPPLSAPSDLGNSEVSKVVEEFERRIAHLESRLEEVFDAKDRLERQVAAQTEELRVQRAAIARTQRVLRTIARPEDDEPSEPAPKL